MTIKTEKRAYIQKRLYYYHYLNDAITFVLPTVMAILYIEFNLNWFQTGLIFAFNSLGTVFFQVIIGYYTDKRYSEILMKAGFFLLAFSSLLIMFSFNFLSLLLFASISGIALSFQHSISYAITSKMYAEDKDVKVGRQGAAGDFGKCSAVFSSAFLMIFFGSWQLPLLIWTVIAFISFVIITINFNKIKFQDYYQESTKDNSNSSEENPKKIVIILIISSYVLIAALFTLIITNLPTFLRIEKIGMVSEFSGLIMGLALIFGIIGSYFSGSVKLKFGMNNSIILISFFIIFLLLFYMIIDTSDLITTLIFYAVLSSFMFLMYPQLLAAINDCIHSKKIGFGYGIMLSFGWFGNFLGSFLGGYFADIYSANAFFVLGIISLIFTIIIMGYLKIKHPM